MNSKYSIKFNNVVNMIGRLNRKYNKQISNENLKFLSFLIIIWRNSKIQIFIQIGASQIHRSCH